MERERGRRNVTGVWIAGPDNPQVWVISLLEAALLDLWVWLCTAIGN